MRNLMIIGVLLVAASAAGWFTVHREDGQTTIKINRDEIRGDAKMAIDKGRAYLENNGQGLRYSGGYNDPSQPNAVQQETKYRYTQQGGQYQAPAEYQPGVYIPLNSSSQSERYQSERPAQPGTGARY